MNIKIRDIVIDDVEQFHALLDTVAKEKLYLMLIEAPPVEEVEKFIANNIENNFPQIVAEVNSVIIGWADFIPIEREGFRHSASLGMGVAAEYREKGVGESLLVSIIDKALASGLTRLSLEVYVDNQRAIALYKKHGFVQEGIRMNARYFEGVYSDMICMSKLI